MINTLYARLVLVLFGLFCMVGGVFLMAALYSADMYQQEVTQRLNRDLAMYIVDEHVLIEDGEVKKDNLKSLFHQAMIINPSLELYLLDAEGNVLSYSDELADVQRQQVSLAPIKEMIAGQSQGPVMGDDPRDIGRTQVFTAAPIMQDKKTQGYIYAILGSERVDHITQLLQHSFIMKWSAGAILVAMIFSFAAGLTIFFLLTRKFAQLGQSMEDFKNSDFQTLSHSHSVSKSPKDEVERMTLTFQEMALRIHTQMTNLQETDALRRDLVANVSHDLRTPLSSLKGYLETLLLKDDTLKEEDRKRYLEIAHQHSERLSKLVLELFELAKLDANELQPNKETFSLAELAHDVSQKFQLRAENKNIHVIVDADESIPFVNADVGMIERVLDNLIDNAFKHTPNDGSIQIKLTNKDDQVDIQVSDTGYGIEKEAIPHVFKRFYRKSNSNGSAQTDTDSSGAGLGLAIAHRIVELHGSQLSVSSVLHQGTEFEFGLPTHSFA